MKQNYIKWNRNWVTVKRHLPIVVKPFIISMILAVVWRLVFFPLGIYFHNEFIEPMLFIVLPLVSFIYVIFAGIAVTSVFDQYKSISKCVVQKDLDTFLLYRDEQLPIMMHLLIAVSTIILVFFIMIFNYQNHVWLAMTTIFSVSFVLVLIWIVTTEIDDFSRSIWFREKVPKEWYLVDIDEHFKKR